MFRGIVLCFLFGQFEVQGCGTLKASSIYIDGVATGRLRLYPDGNWLRYINEKKYRWLKGEPSNWTGFVGYYTNGVFRSGDPRITEDEDYLLVISNMKSSDVGTYAVECFDEIQPNIGTINRTALVQLKLPDKEDNGAEPTTPQLTLTTSTRSVTMGTSKPVLEGDTNNDDKTTGAVIIATMIVVIVVLVAVIMGLVISNKMKSRNKQIDRRAIAKEEEKQSSEDIDHPEVSENIYCEINDPDVTYAKVRDDAVIGSSDNVTIGFSNGALDQKQLLKSQSLADVSPQASSSLQKLYSTVLPKALRGKKNREQAETERTGHQNVEGDGFGGITRKQQRSTIKKNGCQYNSMDCILSPSAAEQGHEYANTSSTLPRSFKRKNSKSTTELTYIEIEHAEDRYAEIDLKVIGTAPSSEYVAIDFDKKAFVPPERKAPRSWKRKHEERKERRKQQK